MHAEVSFECTQVSFECICVPIYIYVVYITCIERRLVDSVTRRHGSRVGVYLCFFVSGVYVFLVSVCVAL